MHEDQIHIDVEIARRLIDDSFPQLRSDSVRPVHSSGTVNAIYRVGENAAARFPLQGTDPDAVQAWLGREADAAAEFAGCCPFATPRPLGFGRPGWSYPLPWSLQTWLDGVIATPTGLEASDVFAADIATLLESLRRADTRGRGFDGEGRGGVIGDQDEWMRTCFANSGELLDVPLLRSIWHELRTLPPADATVMSHKDLDAAQHPRHGRTHCRDPGRGWIRAGGSCARSRLRPGTCSITSAARWCAHGSASAGMSGSGALHGRSRRRWEWSGTTTEPIPR